MAAGPISAAACTVTSLDKRFLLVELVPVQGPQQGGGGDHAHGIPRDVQHGVGHVDETVDACNSGNDGEG